jgi:hypothetical protein
LIPPDGTEQAEARGLPSLWEMRSTMTNHELAAMARLDRRLLQNVVDGRTPDLGLLRIGPALIRRLAMYEEALDSEGFGGTRPS